MAAVDSSVQQNLKFKITSKGLLLNSGEKTAEKAMKLIVRSGISAKSSLSSSTTNKRKAETSLSGEKGKVQKIDRSLRFYCGNILKDLMNDKRGWCPSGPLFNEAVDPVVLMIPDYFHVITNPMDLGTIKSKLEKNLYLSADEFAADVRLTFSNAMRYNPPGHNVHNMAKLLMGHFNLKWKSLEAKLKREKEVIKNELSLDFHKTMEKTKVVTAASKPTSLESKRPKLLLPSERKLKIVQKPIHAEPVKVVQKVVRKEIRVLGKNENLSRSCPAGSQRQVVQKVAQKESRLSGNTEDPSPSSLVRSCPAGSQRQTDAKIRCSSCGDLVCHCRDKTASTKAYSSDISSDRSSERDQFSDRKLDSKAKNPSSINANRSGSDSDGESSLISSIPLSPKTALRAAMLKSRFAGTIFRAKHQGEKNYDPIRMEQERAKLEKQQLEEKARIEKEIKAAKEALRIKTEAESKMQREKEREAARVALLKVERTVLIDVNLDVLKDLEIFRCTPYRSPEAKENPLRKLGLFFKESSDDYMEDAEDEVVPDGEEGEIIEFL